jgi:YD repeat-containing protein
VMTDALGHTTRFDYDSLGRVVTTTRWLSGAPITEVTQYDALGNRVQVSNALSQISKFSYDALGRNVVITDAKTHTTTITYDVLGQRLAQTDGLGHTSVFTYDLAGRQTATADALGNVTRYGYDALGNRTVMTDANGIVTRYEYDTLNRLSAVVENYTGGAQTSDRDVLTRYAYDVSGNRTTITNGLGYATAFVYDALSRLLSSSDPLSNTTAYQYDALGNRTVMTDANGKTTQYVYDALNRPLIVTYTADAKTVSYAYDQAGNRTVMTDSVGVTRYVYDDLYRLTNVSDPYSQVITYTYDAVGNRTNLFYPDGKVVTYTYDDANLMTTVVDWSGKTTAYAYDAANRLVTATLPNGVQTVYTYDDADRLTRLSHTRNGGSETLGDYAFTLDKVGNRLAVTETLMYPSSGGGQTNALPPTAASEVAASVTGQRAFPVSTPTQALPLPGGGKAGLSAPLDINFVKVQATEGRTPSQEWDRLSAAEQPALYAVEPEADTVPIEETRSAPAAPQPESTTGLLLAGDNIFTDGFESGDFSAWSAAVTNTGRLSVTAAAAAFGNWGMQAYITSTNPMYVRDDTPSGETHYRARFYFHPNSISIPNTTAQNILVGRATSGSVEVFRIQFRKSGSNYQISGQIRNDSTGYSSMAWYTISNAEHFVETDWKAATAAGAKNGYLSLWIDGALKETKSGVDNDTRRVDEACLGPSSGIASGTSGTEYFDAFESRQSTYIGAAHGDVC